MRPVALLVILLALAAPAAAQLPSAPCGPIQLALLATEDSVPAGTAREFGGTVGNTGSTPGAAEVDVAEAPDGWNVTVTPASIQLAARDQSGSTGSFTVRVLVPANATAPADVTIGAVLRCAGPLPVQSRAETETLTITPTPPSAGAAERIADLMERYGALALGALVVVALGGAAVVGVNRARAGVVADAPEPLKTVRAGRGTSFPLAVENRERRADTVRFEVGAVPTGWAAFTAVPELTLAPGERRTTWLMVRAPPDAADGAHAAIPIAVRSDARPSRARELNVRAEVRNDPEPPGESHIPP